VPASHRSTKAGVTRFRFVNKQPVLVGNFAAGQYVTKSSMGKYELQFWRSPAAKTDRQSAS
jgi:hypothetical protein